VPQAWYQVTLYQYREHTHMTYHNTTPRIKATVTPLRGRALYEHINSQPVDRGVATAWTIALVGGLAWVITLGYGGFKLVQWMGGL